MNWLKKTLDFGQKIKRIGVKKQCNTHSELNVTPR